MVTAFKVVTQGEMLGDIVRIGFFSV